MDWNQLITALVVGVPAAFWKWLDRKDARSELTEKMELSQEAVQKLTAALDSKNLELDERDDDLFSTREQLFTTQQELHAVKTRLEQLLSERSNP